MTVNYSEHELESLILGNPLDDSLRVQLENLLCQTDPDSVDLELLRREREIAETLDAGDPIDNLIDAYKRFRIAQSDYFWDMRGCLDHLFRPFSLWLVSCNPARMFAVDLAIQNKVNQEIDGKSLPTEFLRGNRPDAIYEIKNGIIDFVRRYRGPSGKEPDLASDEIDIVMLATYSRQTPRGGAG